MPLSRKMSYSYETNVLSYELRVMSTWVWVIITMHCFEYFRGIVDLAPRVSLDGIREGLLYKVYWCSLTMYAKRRGPW